MGLTLTLTLTLTSQDLYRRERSWILSVLSKGLSFEGDLALFRRRHVLPLLLAFADSPLSDLRTRLFVLGTPII